ncbi:VOC family protein [Nocardia sp. NPDC050413]|uniref:VOC family protein n=1 Tax=Nocardia sp. NPDC050413 TaxID=3155784 RepID=UPI0033C8FCA6
MIRWTWAFIDRPAATFDTCVRFWAEATGSTVSPPRGAHGEFVTLLPSTGPAWLKMQRVGGAGGTHLDLDVDDIPAAVAEATALGAQVVLVDPDYTVMESPAGQTFCFTHAGPSPATGAMARVTAPDGNVAVLDQICLDLAPTDLDSDTSFWQALTGWSPESTRRPEFGRLRDPGQPLQFLLQRLDEPRHPGAHIDFAATDMSAVAGWHESLGATRLVDEEFWIVLADPSGTPYCVTSRKPS